MKPPISLLHSFFAQLQLFLMHVPRTTAPQAFMASIIQLFSQQQQD